MYKTFIAISFLVGCGIEYDTNCVGEEFNNPLFFTVSKEMGSCGWLTPNKVENITVDVNEYPNIQHCGEHSLKVEELYFLGCRHIIEPTLYSSKNGYSLAVLWKVYCDGAECMSYYQ